MTSALASAPSETAAPRRLSEIREDVRHLAGRGRIDEAIALMRRLVAAVPDEPRLGRELIVLLQVAGRTVEADVVAVRLDPTDVAAWRRLARYHRRRGELDRFEWALRGWRDADPDCPTGRHFAAVADSLRGRGEPEGAPEGYVRDLFDSYAHRFDEHLLSLGYRAHEAVADEMVRRLPESASGHRPVVGDLGCGTGLVGQAIVERLGGRVRPGLVGVDLSPQMLGRAADRTLPDGGPVYDELVLGDLTSFLAERPGAFDAIATADTFIYLGDLRPVFEVAATALRPGGRLVASIERAAPEVAADVGYRVLTSGRFEHRIDWVISELTRVGFVDVVATEFVVRQENGSPIPGAVVTATVGSA